MRTLLAFLLPAGLLALAGSAAAESYPLLDKAADKVIAKYQSSSCQQLAAERAQAQAGQPDETKQRLVDLLRKDPARRQEFLNRVAAPIANKMLECGFIP